MCRAEAAQRAPSTAIREIYGVIGVALVMYGRPPVRRGSPRSRVRIVHRTRSNTYRVVTNCPSFRGRDL